MPVLSKLTDEGHSVTLVSEADFNHLQDYPVVVVPSLFKPLEESTQKILDEYEAAGGKVLMSDKLGDGLVEAVDGAYEPEIRLVEANGILEIIDFEKDGIRMAQLINGNGKHHDESVMTEDSIAPVKDIVLSLNLPQKPHALYLEPEGRKIRFTWENERAIVKIPEVAIHSTLVIQ